MGTKSKSGKPHFASEYQRQLIRELVDDFHYYRDDMKREFTPLEPLLAMINSMPRWEAACVLLIKNKLVGKALWDWQMIDNNGSLVDSIAKIKQWLLKSSELQIVYGGKDIT